MMALTLKQPWAWAVAEGLKPIENRKWRPSKRYIGQRFAVHAGKSFDEENIETFLRCARAAGVLKQFQSDYEDIRGAVIGVARLGHTHVYPQDSWALSEKALPWFFGPFGFPLSDIIKLASPVRVRGALNFWRLPDQERRAVDVQIVGEL